MRNKVLIIVIVAIIMSLSMGVVALAAETDDSVKEDRQELQASREEKAAQRYTRLHYLFETYFPDGVEALEENREAHIEFHVSAQEDREELRSNIRESFAEIKEAFENEEIDRAEAKTLLTNLRTEVEAMRAEFKLVAEDKKVAQTAVRENLIELREEMKVLLTEDEINTVRVTELLKQTLPLLEKHVENDVFYHGQFTEIVEQYGF